jgi:hypothetical protein
MLKRLADDHFAHLKQNGDRVRIQQANVLGKSAFGNGFRCAKPLTAIGSMRCCRSCRARPDRRRGESLRGGHRFDDLMVRREIVRAASALSRPPNILDR